MPRFSIGKKSLLFILPLLLLAISIFIWQPLVTTIIEWKVQSYCKDCFGSSFHSQNIVWENGILLIEHPTINSNLPVEQGGHSLKADNISFNYDFSFWKKELALTINIENAHFALGKNVYEWVQPILEKNLDDNYIKVVANVVIPKGSLIYCQNNECTFSLEISNKEYLTGNFHILDESGNNLMEVSSKKDMPDRRVFDFSFQNVDITEGLQFLNIVDPSWADWIVHSGKADGFAKIIMEKKARPLIDGNVVLSNFLFEHKKFGVVGNIPEAVLDIAESNNDDKPLGKIAFNQNSSFSLVQEDATEVSLNNISGGIFFKNHENITVDFNGSCTHHGQTFQLSLGGNALYPLQEFASFDVHVQLKAPDTDQIGLRFLGRGVEKGLCFGQLDIANFRKEEFDLLKLTLGKHAKDLDFVKIYQGRLDASVVGYVRDRKIDELNVEKIHARNLHFEIQSWDLTAAIPDVSGSMKINLASNNIFDTLDAEIAINNGNLRFGTMAKSGLQFENIQTQLLVQKGIFTKSIVKAEFAGLAGMIEMDWNSPEEVMKLNFEGGTRDVAKWMPLILQKGFEKKFNDDHILVNAIVKKKAQGLTVSSQISIDQMDSSQHFVQLGFDICKTSESLWKHWPPHPMTGIYCNDLALEVMKSFLPAAINPMLLFQTQWLKKEFGFAGISLKNGWFQANNIPLDKFIEPFIFSEDQFSLIGTGDFQGKFDLNGMSFEYSSRNMIIDNENLSMEFSKLTKDSEQNPSEAKGIHYFDFGRGSNFGILTVKEGCYFEKNSNLLFTDVSTQIIVEGQKFHAKDIETYCNDVYFSGTIDVDYSYLEPGFYDVDVNISSLSGKASNMREIFTHFEPPVMFASLPLEGNISLLDKDAYLRFNFDPDDFALEAKVTGRLSEGTLEGVKDGISIHELGLNFDYDHKAKTLELQDIQGVVFIGKSDQVEEYPLEGSSVRFGDVGKSHAEFDISIGGKGHELLRLAGFSRSKSKNRKDEVLQFVFDKERSHLLGAHPTNLELGLREGKGIENFHLELVFQLENMLGNIKKLGKTGVLFSQAVLQESLANVEKTSGAFHIDLKYDQRNSQFSYSLKGADLVFGSHHIDKCLLLGKKKGSTWSIEQMQLDNLSIAADIVKDDHKCVFNFLGVRWGDTILAGMEGEYLLDQNILNGRFNLLEMDLKGLNELSLLRGFMDKYQPKGNFKATGEFHFEFINERPGWKVETLLNSSVSSFEMLGIRFQDIENASSHFISNERITFRQISTAFKSSQDDSVQGLVSLEKGEYNFKADEVTLDGVQFNIPSENLDWAADNLQRCYPDEINDSIANTIRNSKRTGNLKGNFAFKVQPVGNHLNLQLAEGKYWWLDREHDINNFVLDQSPQGVTVTLQYQYEQHPFWIYCHSNSSRLNRGEVIVSDHLLGPGVKSHPSETVVLDWINDSKFGFVVKKAQGTFAGLGVNLVQDPNEPPSPDFHHFIGDMTVDIRKASSLVSAEFRNSLAGWEFGKGYFLRGKWQFNKNSPENRADYLSFQGNLGGKDVEFKGYQFQSLQAQLNYAFGNIRLNDLIVEDPAGALHIDQIDMLSDRQGDNWTISMGQITGRDFRPSLLRYAGEPPPEMAKPLVIQQIQIEKLHGILGIPQSFTGVGNFTFQNKSRRILNHPLFAIPTEIINRIGLDLAVLNPVTGSVFFNIGDNKIYLTKFKEIYSEGKLSKFNLSHNSLPSYVDFDGNLNLHIRMKQYNLLFKLAELFTVSVRGNIQKPIYSLQKQMRRESNPTAYR